MLEVKKESRRKGRSIRFTRNNNSNKRIIIIKRSWGSCVGKGKKKAKKSGKGRKGGEGEPQEKRRSRKDGRKECLLHKKHQKIGKNPLTKKGCSLHNLGKRRWGSWEREKKQKGKDKKTKKQEKKKKEKKEKRKLARRGVCAVSFFCFLLFFLFHREIGFHATSSLPSIFF